MFIVRNNNHLLLFLYLVGLALFYYLGVASMVARGGMLLCGIIGLYCLYNTAKDSIHLPVFRAVALLVILNFAYWLLSDKQMTHQLYAVNYSTFGYLSNILFNLTAFFVGYFFVKEKVLTDNRMVILYIALFLAALNQYRTEQVMVEMENVRHEGYHTYNVGYAFTMILPYLLLFKRKYLTLPFLLISLFFVFSSAKRGAIVCSSIFTILFLVNSFVINRRGKMSFVGVLISIGIIILILVYGYDYYMGSEYLQYRMDKTLEGDTNGRDWIFPMFWNYWLNSNNIFRYLFGFGFIQSIARIGVLAHNDWLEILFMAGLLGIVVYIFFFTDIFITIFRVKDRGQRGVILMILIVWLVRSMFSQMYLSNDAAGLTFLLGYSVANINNIISRKKEVRGIPM